MPTVLLVDDEISIRKAIRGFLGMAGYTVYCAGNSDEALDILEKNTVDIMVTDIIMPKVSGVQLMQQVRDTGSDITTIVMTGEPDKESYEEALRLGACAYLLKPISGATIMRIVSDITKAQIKCSD